MATLKSFTIAAALLVAGTSLAVAQGAPPGPGVIPHDVTASPNRQSAAPPTGAAAGTRIAPTTRHHRIYMFSRHRPMKTGQPLPKQPQ
jgi:hypothetical protein